MEEALLIFLADNIGSQDTFRPACVYIADNAYDKQPVPDSNGKFVESTALEMELTFIQKDGRNLETCTSSETALCCAQNAISNNIGEFCANLGCNLAQCGRGRHPQKPQIILGRRAAKAGKASKSGNLSGKASKSVNLSGKAGKSGNLFGKASTSGNLFEKTGKSSKSSSKKVSSMQSRIDCLWYGRLGGYDFNEVVRSHTSFQPEMIYALLNATDTDSVASCSANRYSIDSFGTPSLTCDEFESKKCDANEDLPVGVGMKYQRYSAVVGKEGGIQQSPKNLGYMKSAHMFGYPTPKEYALQGLSLAIFNAVYWMF